MLSKRLTAATFRIAPMADLEKNIQRAKELVAEEKWQEATGILMPLYEEGELLRSSEGHWGVVPLIKSLRKLQRSQEALGVARKVAASNNKLSSPNSLLKEIIYGLAAWCVWDIEFKNSSSEGPNLDGCQRIRKTLERVEADLSKEPSPYVLSALETAKKLNGVGRFKDAISVLDVLSPEKLDTDHFQTGDGKSLPSSRERWFIQLSKAYDKTEDWNSLLEICNRGVGDDAISESMKYFLQHRLGKAHRHLGNLDEAFKILQTITRRRLEWWALHDLAIVKWEQGDHDGAIKYSCIALLETQIDELVTNVLLDLADWVLNQDKFDAGSKFTSNVRSCIQLIWESNEWPVKEKLKKQLEKLPGAETLKKRSLDEVKKEILKSVFKMLNKIDPPIAGSVKGILPNGKSMFLQREGKKDVFARIPRGLKLKEGDPVTFRLFPSYDKKRNLETMLAIHVRRAKGI